MIKHATLSTGGLIGMDVQARKCVSLCFDETMKPESLEDLFYLAELHEISMLWVRAGVVEPDKSFAHYDDSQLDLSRINWTRDGKHVVTVSGWRLGGGQHRVTLVFCDYCSWAKDKKNRWMKDATDKELLITFLYLEEGLKVDMSSHPGTMGWNIIRRDKTDQIAGQGVHLEEREVDWGRCATDLVWELPQSAHQPKGKYLHKFDKNSAYPSAATTEFYGVGHLIDVNNYDGKQVGVWYVNARQTRATDLPRVFDQDQASWSGWVAGPYIRLLQSQGYEAEIVKGYAFKGRHQLLAKFAEFIWNARQDFKDENKWKHPKARQYAGNACKQIANTTIGFTAYHKFDGSDDKRRPDVKMQTVARTYEIMYHNIVKYSSSYGLPIAVYMDALYYRSEHKDARQAFKELLERETKLGGFKLEGTIEITPEVDALLHSEEPLNMKLTQLNKIGWVK